MPAPGISVRPATIDDRAAVVHALARAFEHDAGLAAATAPPAC
jgi:hypothetical protein